MENKHSFTNINIATTTIIKVIAICLLLYFLYIIKDVLALLFVSLILASAFDPWVDWMQSRKIPRVAGIVFIYLVMVAVIGTAIYLIVPPISEQLAQLSDKFPAYIEKLSTGYSAVKQFSDQHGFMDNLKDNLNSVTSNLQDAAGGVFTTITGIFGGIFSFFLVLVMTFYMVVEENAMKKVIWSIAPVKHQPYIMNLVNRMQKKIGMWLRGQLVLCLIIFILDYIGLTILGVEYGLVLALIAGITEIIPYFGPILGAIPAVFLAFAQKPMLGLLVLILFYSVHLVESNILVPKIMQKAVGMNPLISISVLLIGFKLGGVVGAILSIPVATAISVFVYDFFETKEHEEAALKA